MILAAYFVESDLFRGLFMLPLGPPGFPVSRFEFEQIDLAITSVLANQPVASESERARDQYQSAAVTPPVNLSFCSCLASPDIYLTLLL